MKYFAMLWLYYSRAIKRIRLSVLRSLFKSHGRNFTFDPYGHYSYKTITVGDDVYIGPGACLLAGDSFIEIGSKVMLAPNVTVVGGDHNIQTLGKYMYDVKEKKIGDDLPVYIQDDVWIGTGAIILKGVTIGKGSVVGAGSLVNIDVPPYSIVAGIPAKVVKMRFDSEQIKTHERILRSQIS